MAQTVSREATSGAAKGPRTRLTAYFRPHEGVPGRLSLGLKLTLFIIIALAWWSTTAFGLVKPLFVPAPATVADAFVRMYLEENFLADLGTSVYRVAIGFGIAAAIGTPLGVLMGTFQVVRSLFEPILAFFRYMPATAFIPLLILWLGVATSQKLAVIFIGTFFHYTLLVMDVTRNVPHQYIESGHMLGASIPQIVRKVVWPASQPGIMNNLRIILGWAWTYIVVAEMVAADQGVGHVILRASRFLETETIFVGILSIGVVGIASDYAFHLLGRYLFPYIKHERDA
jgi:NitT/TauT family transport system permease protein